MRKALFFPLMVSVSIIFIVALTALAAPQQTPAPTNAAAQQSPQDVKGWRGAEWGMTPEQVAAVLNQPLGEPKRFAVPPWGDIPYYKLSDVTVGAWKAAADLRFKDNRLIGVVLYFPETVPEFRAVRDELVATYGPPTSESGPTGRAPEARWTLTHTQIAVIGLGNMSEIFEQRVKAF